MYETQVPKVEKTASNFARFGRVDVRLGWIGEQPKPRLPFNMADGKTDVIFVLHKEGWKGQEQGRRDWTEFMAMQLVSRSMKLSEAG